MKPEDLSADYSELTEWELKVLDDWVAYYTKVCFLVRRAAGPSVPMVLSSFGVTFKRVLMW
jgi:hypothetical protein